MTTQWPETFRETVKKSITEIPADACSAIKKVGTYAFYSCTSLTSVTLPSCTNVGTDAFYSCTKLKSIDLPSCTNVEEYAFGNCTRLTSLNLPSCTSVGNSAIYMCYSLTSVNLSSCTSIDSQAFRGCSGLTSINLPLCTSVGSSAFLRCTSLTSINLPSCASVDGGAFNGCTSLTSINLPSCASVGGSAFEDCTSLTSLNLPACTSISYYTFYNCDRLAGIHFSWRNKAVITSLYGYTDKFGASNATIYFDLGTAPMTLSEVSGVTYIIDDTLVTDSDLQDGNVYGIVPEETHSIVAYKAGYCLFVDTITVADETAFDYTPVWTTEGTTYTIDASSAPSGTPEIKFKYNGIEIASVGGTTLSITVPAGTVIDYEVTLDGYQKHSETITSSTNTTITISDWSGVVATTYDMSYPFTGYDAVLANLVDGNNFIVAESPTPYNSSYNTMLSSIVSGAKTFNVNSSYAYGYIKFHTPSTTDTELLTVSVTCNAYAERSYDIGFVFIDKTLHEITSNVKPTTSSGNTDSTYGYMLYNSYRKSTATYSTYTKVLDADTDYYLQFAYTKDSSSSSYWDRLSITNIKFTDTGTY